MKPKKMLHRKSHRLTNGPVVKMSVREIVSFFRWVQKQLRSKGKRKKISTRHKRVLRNLPPGDGSEYKL